MTKISVIIPTWNRADTIEKAIYSALAQTVSPLEVLVCDDGSTDNTKVLVQSVNDPRVKWIQGPRGGRPAIPRNCGISESMGEWLAFLDSDDEWLPEKLEKQLCLAKKLNCIAACSNARRFIPDKGIAGNLLLWSSERITFDDLLHGNHVICSSALIHRSLFASVVGFPESVKLTAIEDYALWLRVATKTDFAFAGQSLLIYRDDPMASIRKKGVNALAQRRRVLSDFREWAKKRNIPSIYLRKAQRQLVTDLLNPPKTKFLDFAMHLKKAFPK